MLKLHTPLCDLLGIQYPIFLAGMGGRRDRVVPPELVAAVSNAGGLGVTGLTDLPPEEIRRCIRRIRELTDRPFGIDLLLPASMEDPEAGSLDEVWRRLERDYPRHVEFVRKLAEEFNLPDVRSGNQFIMSPRTIREQVEIVLEERVPQTRPLSREEALAELTTRYFRSRGPATLNDFAWWSGLTMADAKKAPRAYFLPNYDDYFIGFRDRSAIAEVVRRSNLLENNPSLIPHLIILDGQIVGGWKRTLKKGIVIVEVNLITDLTVAAKQIVTDAVDRYGKFLGLPPWIVGMG